VTISDCARSNRKISIGTTAGTYLATPTNHAIVETQQIFCACPWQWHELMLLRVRSTYGGVCLDSWRLTCYFSNFTNYLSKSSTVDQWSIQPTFHLGSRSRFKPGLYLAKYDQISSSSISIFLSHLFCGFKCENNLISDNQGLLVRRRRG
jgi:hypothetical protein